MNKIQQHWRRVPVAVRKPFILIAGCTVVAVGLVMLVTPGPGWAAIFVGFAILATEFAFAERARDQMIAWLKKIIKTCKAAWRKITRQR